MRTLVLLLLSAASAQAATATRYVAVTGSDSGGCTLSPCRTIAYGIGQMNGGDTLIVGDGTYTDPIVHMPSGTTGAYTTIRAASDWGVLIDGSKWSDSYNYGINVSARSYVAVRGFRVISSQQSATNGPVIVPYSDHVKLQRIGGAYASTTGNAATFSIGPTSSYVLVEESYAYGGGRYQFLVYQSDHVVVRRSVARLDYWNDVLQCADFTNYDSYLTAWQNDIAIDSDAANCRDHMFGGWFNENKTDAAPDTSEQLQGDIVLNVQAYYGGDLDWVMSGTRTISDMIIWGSSGGYYVDQGPGVTAMLNATRLSIGGIGGTYDGPNSGAAWGTGVSVYANISNSVTHSVFAKNHSFGIADYTNGDYNAFAQNGANYGGYHEAVVGPHDLSAENGTAVDVLGASLLWLPRIEPGSPLKTAGQGGAQIGAEVMYMTGATGSLWGDDGWDQLTGQSLWPFPNEDVIRSDMAAYVGPGGAGKRGFTTGTSMDGTPQTLTKYIWEYLGHEIPADVYGVHAPPPDAGVADARPPPVDAAPGAPDARVVVGTPDARVVVGTPDAPVVLAPPDAPVVLAPPDAPAAAAAQGGCAVGAEGGGDGILVVLLLLGCPRRRPRKL